jgi:hypothetical protein
MKYTIEIMKTILIFDDKKLQGYSFIDEWGHGISIVYGESKRNLMIKLLSETLP